MDNLKKYLQQHNNEMDTDEPGIRVWNNIELEHKKTGKLSAMFIRIAAAAAILTGIIITAIKLADTEKINSLAVQEIPTSNVHKEILADNNAATSVDTVNINTASVQPFKENIKKKVPVDERYAMMKSFKENYGQLVNYQLSSIRSTAVYAENPAYFDDFKTRLQQMDLDELTIRKRIKEKGMSNNLLDQLINVYQQKLDVLKSLQAEINKMNEMAPAADSTNKYYLNI